MLIVLTCSIALCVSDLITYVLLVINSYQPSAMNGSTDVLEHILSHDECDVDPINRMEKQTPLHCALRIDHPQLRVAVIESLLDAGADTT